MATWSVRVALVLIALFRGLLSQSSYFYPYGTAVGDTQHPAVDDACSITHSNPLPIFGITLNTFYICTNGIISLDGSYTSYTPSSFPLSTGVTIIAPFWADANLASGGALWSRETNSSALLNNVSSIVSNVYGTSFTAVWSLVVTWENVIAFGSSNHCLTNSFQCLLVTDGFSTYAMYLYGDIQWTYGSASSSIPAQVGFDAGDGVNFYAVPDSRTSAIIDIELDSNIGRRGQWMFRLDNSVIQTPALITTTPTMSTTSTSIPTTTTILPTTTTSLPTTTCTTTFLTTNTTFPTTTTTFPTTTTTLPATTTTLQTTTTTTTTLSTTTTRLPTTTTTLLTTTTTLPTTTTTLLTTTTTLPTTTTTLPTTTTSLPTTTITLPTTTTTLLSSTTTLPTTTTTLPTTTTTLPTTMTTLPKTTTTLPTTTTTLPTTTTTLPTTTTTLPTTTTTLPTTTTTLPTTTTTLPTTTTTLPKTTTTLPTTTTTTLPTTSTTLPTTTTTFPTTTTTLQTTTTTSTIPKTTIRSSTTITRVPATTTMIAITTSSRLSTGITTITPASTTTTYKNLTLQEKMIQDIERAAPIASPLFALLIFLGLLFLIRKWKKSHNVKVDIEEDYEKEISSQAPRDHNWHAHLFVSPEVIKSLAPVSDYKHANDPRFSSSPRFAGQPLYQPKLHPHVDRKVNFSENNADVFQSLPPVHHAWPERFMLVPTSNLEYVQTNCNAQPKGISVIQERNMPHLLKDSHILTASKPVPKVGWMDLNKTLPDESHETELTHLQVGLRGGKSSVTPQVISTKHSLSGTIDDAVKSTPDQTVRKPRRGKELAVIRALDMRVSVTNMSAESDAIQECAPGSENTAEKRKKTRKNKRKGKKQKKQSTEALIEPVELMESFTIQNETETDYRAENPKSVRPKKAKRKKRRDTQKPITNTLAELDSVYK